MSDTKITLAESMSIATTNSPRHPLPTVTAAFETLVLAGGGNRCWWQAGALSYLAAQGWQLPATLVGTSAGAAIAAACVTTSAEAALAACQQLYADNERIFHWRALLDRKLVFAHQWLYPAWIQAVVDDSAFESLRNGSTSLWVAVTRPAPTLGLGWSVCAGTIAYILNKKVWRSVHPHLPKTLGLRQEFLLLNDCRNASAAQNLLCAAAAPPPIMPARDCGGTYAFDGGYTDNAPVPPQSPAEQAATLVMLTRRYPARADIFQLGRRHYWQPSRPIPVSTWDCTRKATVQDAFSLGYEDARRTLNHGFLRKS